MSRLNGVAEMLQLMDECLVNADWARMASITTRRPMGKIEATRAELTNALGAVHAMQTRLEARLAAVSAEIDDLPALRKAARAYLAS